MRRFFAYLSILAGLFLFATYWLRPDWATATTIFPSWSWLIVWALAIPAYQHWSFKVACVLWLMFTLSFVEEIGSLSKFLLPENNKTAHLRVVTINCSGSMDALLSALEGTPDIVLIQETPQQKQVLEWVEQHDSYEYAHGIDTSILVKGRIQEIGTKAFFYNTVWANIDDESYHITSLRLSTSNPRMDLWNPDCWAKQRWKRERQMEQIAEVVQVLPEPEEAYTIILGGDFNVPQGDRVFSEIDQFLVDSFASGGRGWCNTIVDSLPLLRIDQIWTSTTIRSHRAYAANAEKTDHKMYVTEFSPTE